MRTDQTSALPEGWKLAYHRRHGCVVAASTTPDKYGRVVVTSAPDADGRFVDPAVWKTTGRAWHSCTPDELTYLDANNRALEEA